MVSRLRCRAGAVGLLAALSVLAVPATAWAGGPGAWTTLAQVDGGTQAPSLLRTPDGALHVVWQAPQAANLTHSFGASTISLTGKLVATSTVLAGWSSLEPDPQILRDGSGLRVVFEGGTGPASGCYNRAAVFTATSTDGSSWNLAVGSLDHQTAGVGNLAATTLSDGIIPVAVFAGGHLFHLGVDPTCPAVAPDIVVTPTPGSTQNNPTVVTDTANGTVWDGWFQGFVQQAYWVDQILPTQGAPIEAPGSASTPSQNNQPLQRVALVARPGGGEYMAYCTATNTEPCAHIDLWKVGAPTAKVVPGSANVNGARVALAAGLAGRLSVVWYDAAKNIIHSIRTNANVTAFGQLRTVKPPKNTSQVLAISGEGTFGRLDVVVTDRLTTTVTPSLFHTQILPGLSLTAKPAKFSDKHAKNVTFTVADAGQPVSGATVKCLGKRGKTKASGTVKLKFKKGVAAGKHVCSATKLNYNNGLITIKVTKG